MKLLIRDLDVCDVRFPTSRHLDPTWVMGYDLYPLDCIDNRHRYYRHAIPGKWLTVFTHDHEVPWSYVEMGYKNRPVARHVEP